MKYKLRPYQETAVNKMSWDLGNEGNSIVSLPTGSGKTHVISGFVEANQIPVLILTKSKELLEQNFDKLKKTVSEDEIGLYSASVNSKVIKKYTLATIGSVYKTPELFNHYKVAIVDECHEIDVKKEKTMYRKLFSGMSYPKVFGLTATPYRQDVYYHREGGWNGYSGTKYQKMGLEAITTTKMLNRYKSGFWSRMLCAINTQELTPEYLCPLEYSDLSKINHADIPLNVTQSDFDLNAYERLWSKKEEGAIRTLSELTQKHQSILVFCSSIEQAKRLNSVISGSNYLESNMPRKQRESVINGFRKQGGLLFNVGILTTGFDYPELSSVCLIRPTRSLSLYNQMLGRLTRKAEGKRAGFVYDFSGTLKSIGRLESIQVTKNLYGWDVTSETRPEGWHGQPLHTHKIR